MKSPPKDYFAIKAETFDSEKSITQNVGHIGQIILKNVSFSKEMHIMDFGSGTGLLLSQIAPYVGKITAVDISPSMTGILKSKIETLKCKLEIVELDLTTEKIDTKFAAIISSMTIHHIENVQELFNKFYSLLYDHGTIAIADLDVEDGTFHAEDTGVFHLGFNRAEFLGFAEKAGFKNLKIQTASIMNKPTGTYSVFLLTGEK